MKFSFAKNNILVYCIIGLTMLITQPTSHFFTIYQRDLGLDLAIVGIIAAAGAIFDMLGRFSAGVFSDRKGRKKPLFYLVLASLSFPFLLIFFNDMTSLLIINIIHSVVNAAFWTVIIAYLYDTNPQSKCGRVYSQAITALLIINFISPIIGGIVIERFGYQWLFSLSCYIAIIPLVLVFFLKNPIMQRQALSIKGEVSDILNKPRFIKVWTVMLIIGFSSSFITTFFPIYLYEQFSLTYTQVGLFFSAGTIILVVLQPLLGWLADRFKSKFVIPANMLVMSIGLIAMTFVSSVIGLFLTKAIFPVGVFGARNKGAANVAKMTPNEEHALAQALFKSSSGVSWTIMNIMSPLLIASIGYSGVFRMLGVISGLAGIWYFFAYNKHEKVEKEGLAEHIKHHHAFSFSDLNLLEHYRHK